MTDVGGGLPFSLEMSPREHGPDAVIGLTDLTTEAHPDLVRECGTIGRLLAKKPGLAAPRSTRSGPRIAGQGARDQGRRTIGVPL
jgi:hypothetical protein